MWCRQMTTPRPKGLKRASRKLCAKSHLIIKRPRRIELKKSRVLEENAAIRGLELIAFVPNSRRYAWVTVFFFIAVSSYKKKMFSQRSNRWRSVPQEMPGLCLQEKGESRVYIGNHLKYSAGKFESKLFESESNHRDTIRFPTSV